MFADTTTTFIMLEDENIIPYWHKLIYLSSWAFSLILALMWCNTALSVYKVDFIVVWVLFWERWLRLEGMRNKHLHCVYMTLVWIFILKVRMLIGYIYMYIINICKDQLTPIWLMVVWEWLSGQLKTNTELLVPVWNLYWCHVNSPQACVTWVKKQTGSRKFRKRVRHTRHTLTDTWRHNYTYQSCGSI